MPAPLGSFSTGLPAVLTWCDKTENRPGNRRSGSNHFARGDNADVTDQGSEHRFVFGPNPGSRKDRIRQGLREDTSCGRLPCRPLMARTFHRRQLRLAATCFEGIDRDLEVNAGLLHRRSRTDRTYPRIQSDDRGMIPFPKLTDETRISSFSCPSG